MLNVPPLQGGGVVVGGSVTVGFTYGYSHLSLSGIEHHWMVCILRLFVAKKNQLLISIPCRDKVIDILADNSINFPSTFKLQWKVW